MHYSKRPILRNPLNEIRRHFWPLISPQKYEIRQAAKGRLISLCMCAAGNFFLWFGFLSSLPIPSFMFFFVLTAHIGNSPNLTSPTQIHSPQNVRNGALYYTSRGVYFLTGKLRLAVSYFIFCRKRPSRARFRRSASISLQVNLLQNQWVSWRA